MTDPHDPAELLELVRRMRRHVPDTAVIARWADAALGAMPDPDTLPQVEMPEHGDLIIVSLPDGGIVVRQHGSMRGPGPHLGSHP